MFRDATFPKRSYQRVRVVRRWGGHQRKCKSGDPTLTVGLGNVWEGGINNNRIISGS